ncbi:uncharacterized protein KY384_008893 [Bacidia gigantensis]|uniref:uncharacterized protein n=1 Tax=Bacidia gigantensis TaxID=2732470 RepID=UPI001D0385FE|nr:uncharacterized protein KY384_008893 [Bacidia gigantensis]KAG8525249.1 hypothetical protein KY384_008893 [Bacidia gigantensis]
MERQATKKKLKSLNAFQMMDDGIEAEHICTRACGRLLKCGNHTCPELCHRGPCGSCREAIFDELACHCGKTVLQPPLPCGTASPPCRFECERPKHCSHPQVPHNCHGGDEKCPKCPFLSQKPCLCGKKVLKNQPCFATEVRCGEVCGAKLKCGAHACRKQCHRPGECEDAGTRCLQQCGKTKKVCEHSCDDICHAPSSCKEDKPCQHKMYITCECQNLKQEVKCNASKNADGNSKKTLTCDDECARLARNHRLAEALNIDIETHTDDHVPYSTETMKLYRANINWAHAEEREMRIFAADEDEKRLRFKPGPPHQRAFLHALAEDFGFDSESIDPEPHRHILIFKTPRFVKAPMKTLAQCLRIRLTQASSLTASTEEPARRINPFNGFLLLHPRFGLTVDDLRGELLSAFQSTPGLAYDISFPSSGDQVIIRARPATASTAISPTAVEASLKSIKPTLSAIISAKKIAFALHLCTSDAELSISRRENDGKTSTGVDGWSQVAAKGAAPRVLRPKEAVGKKSGFTVLGSRVKEKKMKEVQKEVVEDWEEEIEREEKEAHHERGDSDEVNDRGESILNEGTIAGSAMDGEDEAVKEMAPQA